MASARTLACSAFLRRYRFHTKSFFNGLSTLDERCPFVTDDEVEYLTDLVSRLMRVRIDAAFDKLLKAELFTENVLPPPAERTALAESIKLRSSRSF